MLVTTDWLQPHLDDRDLVVVDLRWHEDGSGRARYEAGHIPGAVFCDWSTDLVDTEHRFAFMLAPPWRFAEQMRRLGISDETKVVAYSDRLGSGPFRLWWACRVYGHQQVRILDGGLKKWLGEERPVSSTSFRPRPGHEWTPRHGEPLVATGQDVAEGERDPRITVLDSRPEEQFLGEAVWFERGPILAHQDGVARTPRGDIRAGRVPWARSMCWARLYRPDQTLKSAQELRALFASAGVGPDSRVITYCGVGISAAALLYAARCAGITHVSLYDGSWDEWGRDVFRPVARGR